MIKETLSETSRDAEKDLKHFTIVEVGNQIVPEPQAVAPVIATMNAQGLVHFSYDYKVVSTGCKPFKNILEAFSIRFFYISVSTILERPQSRR